MGRPRAPQPHALSGGESCVGWKGFTRAAKTVYSLLRHQMVLSHAAAPRGLRACKITMSTWHVSAGCGEHVPMRAPAASFIKRCASRTLHCAARRKQHAWAVPGPPFLADTLQSVAPIRVCLTGAAGQIAYSLVYMIAKGDMFGPNQVPAWIAAIASQCRPARHSVAARHHADDGVARRPGHGAAGLLRAASARSALQQIYSRFTSRCRGHRHG